MRMLDKRQEMMAKDSIGKLLFKLSLPAAVGSLVMAFYNIVDTIFIGQAVGPQGITALTVVFPLQILAMGMGMMIGMGGSSIISRNLGANNIERAEKVLGNSMFYAIALGIIVTAVGLAAPTLWLKIAGTSDAIMVHALDYFIIIFIGMPFRIFAMGISQLIRAEGNAKMAMLGMVSGFIINIILDAVFILGMDMGIKGAALATLIAEIFSFGLIAYYYFFGSSSLKVKAKHFKPEFGIAKEMIAIGFGSFVMTIGGSFITITINRTLAFYGGDMGIATFGMLHRTMMIVFIPIMSIGQGLQPILGFSYGAGRIDRALSGIKLSIVVASVMAVSAFLVVYFAPSVFMRAFTQDEALISASVSAAKIMFLAAGLLGFQTVATTVFQALGKVLPTFLTSTSRQILFVLPLIFLLPPVLGLNGIWITFPIADGLAFLLTLVLFIREIRLMKKPGAVLNVKRPPFGPPGGFGGGGMRPNQLAGTDTPNNTNKK